MHKCKICPLEYLEPQLLYKHTRYDHAQKILIKHSDGCIGTVNKNIDGKFACPVAHCFKKYSNSAHLQRHCNEKHTGAITNVEPAQKGCKLQMSNGNFVNVATDEKGKLKCPAIGCNNGYTRIGNLKAHFTSHEREYESMESQHTDPIPVRLQLQMNNNTPTELQNQGLQVVSVEGLNLMLCKHCSMCIVPEKTHIFQHVNSKQHQINTLQHGNLTEIMIEAYASECGLSTIEVIKNSTYFEQVVDNFPCAVPGLPIQNGFGCNKCCFVTSSRESFKKHHKHENTSWKENLLQNIPFQQLFTKPPHHSLSRVSVPAEQYILPKRINWDLLLPNRSAAVNVPQANAQMDPFLRKSFWLEYAKIIIPCGTKYEDIAVSIDSSNAKTFASTLKLHNLRGYVLAYYKEMRKMFPKVEHEVLRIITPSGNNQLFSPLWTLESVDSYAKYVADFVYLLSLTAIEDYEHVVLCRSLVGLHVNEEFNDRVALLLQYLAEINECANNRGFQYNFKWIHSVLLMMFTYAPEEMSVQKSCEDPVLRYHLITSLQAGSGPTDYGFRSVHTVTSPLSMLLYACRGVILMELTQELWSRCDTHENFAVAKQALISFCTDTGVSTTFTRVKHLKALATTMASVTPVFPVITNVSNNREEFTISGKRFSITMLRLFVKSITEQIENQMQTVLMKYNDTWIKNIVNAKVVLFDNWNNTQTGYWFGNDPANKILQHKDTLLDNIILSPRLRSEFIQQYSNDPTQIRWNKQKCASWMADAHELLALLTVLLHVTSSCGPPRAKEYSNYSFVNTGYVIIT